MSEKVANYDLLYLLTSREVNNISVIMYVTAHRSAIPKLRYQLQSRKCLKIKVIGLAIFR